MIQLSEGLIELMNLERQHPKWDETRDVVKEKMVKLALAHGGFEAFRDKKHYLDYILKLSEELYFSYSDEREKDVDKLTQKLAWFSGLIHEHYSPSMKRKILTERKKAKIYVEVEKYLLRHPKSSVNQASKEVAKKLGEDTKYVNTRYYEMRKKNPSLTLEEFIEKFQLGE